MALSGKIAVVTGAAMGIGKAITEILLQNGATVALLDVNEPAAKALMDELQNKNEKDRALFLKCDVESEEQIQAAFQKTIETFGRVDILCNNAGIVDETNWKKTISINLEAVISGTYLALEHMNKMTGGQGGVIVNTASMTGVYPVQGCPVYTATKHGVVGFTRAMAINSTASGYGIRLNAICPGPVKTELLNNSSLKLGQFSPLQQSANQILEVMGILSASDVAEAVLELVTDETKNGEALVILGKGKHFVAFPSM
ncbi:15-hydroxyprostaglandin dehydrogenase [NAD(+)] [Channa argus]|uniref:15-hydroxyprostaglandin dehydrogenase [NAD(+)] n=1 Tax=Channa argus TaxID=215402 RepID=A0A6G1QSA3_CHAAH|nr:15-hydroxyprostaglandin dehydrogenase [NAD(+)] [Channa argus]KAK2882195.1 hypothetical protein Q8A73_022705 [Channa argus]